MTPCFPNASLVIGEGGEVESGETEVAYCELEHDIDGGDPALSDETDAMGDIVPNSRAVGGPSESSNDGVCGEVEVFGDFECDRDGERA